MIRFSCPGCQSVYTVPDDKGGKTGVCPKCKTQFNIPMPEGAAPPPAPAPTPAAPPPAAGPKADFSFGDDEQPTPKKKPKSKPDLDEEMDEAPKPKKKFSSKEEDDEEDEDFDRPKKKAAGAGKGLAIMAGVLHCIFGLLLLVCGGLSVVGGGCLTAAGSAGTQVNSQFKADINNSSLTKKEKDDLKKLTTDSDKVKSLGTVMLVGGVCNMLFGVLAIPAGIGCFMRKPFGKYLSFVVGPCVLVVRLITFLASFVIMGSDSTTGDMIGTCVGTLIVAVYAGLTVFGALKGIPTEGGSKKKKKADDEDDAEEPEEEEAPKPKKKPAREVEEEEDEEPKPRKKKRRDEDDD